MSDELRNVFCRMCNAKRFSLYHHPRIASWWRRPQAEVIEIICTTCGATQVFPPGEIKVKEEPAHE